MNFNKVLITGITGSGGSYVAEYIAKNFPDIQIHGTSRTHTNASDSFLASIANKVKIHECDLLDFSATLNILEDISPDAIFHLAANANVRASWSNPLSVMHNNVMSTANLLEAIAWLEKFPVVQLCSTSEVYGMVDKSKIPIKEDCPLNPVSPYAISKTTQDLMGASYFMAYKIPIIRTRMFSYVNPRRTNLAQTHFAMQVAKIELGLQEELLHGNLESIRTWLDVRDCAESYWVATTKGRPGEVYNLGGTNVVKIGDFLEALKAKAKCAIPCKLDSSLLRPVDVTLQIPCTDKFCNETGWKPRYSFDESVDFLLEYCRKEVRKGQYV